jgi:DNA-binding transcriptional ArsR family regulator
MVEYTLQLDSVFASLADPTRRDILSRLLQGRLTVSEIALPYDVSLAAISKHLKILEGARMIRKKREGRKTYITLSPAALRDADEYLKQYENIWNQRFDNLEAYLDNND